MSNKQLLILTVRKVILSLIGIGVVAAMFWYVNTYIYKFYAGSATVKIDSSSTISQTDPGKEFKLQVVLSGQKIETADLYILYNPTLVQYMDKIETVPAGYFKLPPDYSKVTSVGNQNQLRLILLAAQNVKTTNNIQVNLTFKALKSGAATIFFDTKTLIAGTDKNNNATFFDSDLTKASKKITIGTPPVPSTCKPEIITPANNSVVPELVNGKKQLKFIWKKCPSKYYMATISGPNIPVDKLPYYLIDDSNSPTSITHYFDIATSMEIGGKYEMQIVACVDDRCKTTILPESDIVTFYYGKGGKDPSEGDVPPWKNDDYTTTTVWGAVQSDNVGPASAGMEYWQQNDHVCTNTSYPVAPEMNVGSQTLNNCYIIGNTQLPFFLTKIKNVGTGLLPKAYTLEGLPEHFKCVNWEYRLRMKSDGSPKLVAQGNGCTTIPLDIKVQNKDSLYENSHFLLFKIKGSSEKPPHTETFDSTLKMKVRFQGITQEPKEQYRKLQAEVTLKDRKREVVSKDVEFTAEQGGTWIGEMGVDNLLSTSKFTIYIKGEKHLAKKICVMDPSEELAGTYKCDEGEISLQKGENNLDFSNIVLLGGDLPQQDGMINALDYVFIRQNLGNTEEQNLKRGDLNLDGIIDTQDHTVIKTALEFKYDEE